MYVNEVQIMCIHMYANAKVMPVEMFQESGEGDKRE
jgi:hypothetical protein